MNLPKRKKNRLRGYDYSSSGAYFITICTKNRACILSSVAVGDGSPVPLLKDTGKIVDDYIKLIPKKYPFAHIDKYVIMPNHIHFILTIEKGESFDYGLRGTGNPSPTTVGEIIGWFKYQTTKCVNEKRKTIGQHIWQRSYHDHIIRNDEGYRDIYSYIDINPAIWEKDIFYIE